jgi:Ca-activated chloride channel family protein
MHTIRLGSAVITAFIAARVVSVGAGSSAPQADGQEGFRFRSGIELVNVTATITDESGRFVSGLQKEDFAIWENGQPQEISHFSSERVPVSLGIALDTSGSMTPDKMSSARSAIDRMIFDLLQPDDELFFLRFANRPQVAQDWTTDRRAISRAVGNSLAAGGTALYDAVAEAVPVAQTGQNRKKALLVISDGNDTTSRISVSEVRHIIRESEVLVYALGVDGRSSGLTMNVPRVPLPIPFPLPGRRPQPRLPPIGGNPGGTWSQNGERVNVGALRAITDDTGGRTEIVRSFADLDAATSHIADELSRQYYLGYVSTGKRDGRWHAIRVEVRNKKLNVRARQGYIAS